MITIETIAPDLLEATLRHALAAGGDFAEVFIEDRVGLGLRLEDDKIEQTSGGH